MARTMHQTTVRFGADLWHELVREAERGGVSVAQYVREAAVARLARGGAFAEPSDAPPAGSHWERAPAAPSSSAVLGKSELSSDRSQRL